MAVFIGYRAAVFVALSLYDSIVITVSLFGTPFARILNIVFNLLDCERLRTLHSRPLSNYTLLSLKIPDGDCYVTRDVIRTRCSFLAHQLRMAREEMCTPDATSKIPKLCLKKRSEVYIYVLKHKELCW